MKQRTRLMFSGDEIMGPNMHSDKKNEDESEIQLHRIRPQEHFIEAQVQEGDTLQAIALRFYCSIAELKRINHIHKDNEIFARRTIKVPVTPYSVLTEIMPSSNQPEPIPSTSSQSHTNTNTPEHKHVNHNGSLENNNVAKNIEMKNMVDIDYNAIVLNSTVAASVMPYTDGEPGETVSEGTQLLPNKEKVSVEAVVVKELTSHGADFGLKWYHLVCGMLVLGVVIPLWYVVFRLDKHEHSDLPPLQST